jgi:hypothetical protein
LRGEDEYFCTIGVEGPIGSEECSEVEHNGLVEKEVFTAWNCAMMSGELRRKDDDSSMVGERADSPGDLSLPVD